jgi:hypothetical protein
MHDAVINPGDSQRPETVIFEERFNNESFTSSGPVSEDGEEGKYYTYYNKCKGKITQRKSNKCLHGESLF